MRKIKRILQSMAIMCLIVVCGVLSVKGDSASANTAVCDSDMLINCNSNEDILVDDLVYHSYINAYELGQGSSWTIRDFEMSEKYDDAYICMLNLKNQIETVIAKYEGQKEVSYEVTEDGVYRIYMYIVKGENVETVDLYEQVDVKYLEEFEVVNTEEADSIIQLH